MVVRKYHVHIRTERITREPWKEEPSLPCWSSGRLAAKEDVNILESSEVYTYRPRRVDSHLWPFCLFRKPSKASHVRFSPGRTRPSLEQDVLLGVDDQLQWKTINLTKMSAVGVCKLSEVV